VICAVRVMNTRRIWRKRLLIGFLVAYQVPILAIWLLAELDYSCLAVGAKPLFARSGGALLDGGTEVWNGVGYQVVSLHSIHVEGDRYGHRVGPQRIIWAMAIYPCLWPFIARGNTRIEWADHAAPTGTAWTEDADPNSLLENAGTNAPESQH